MSSERPIERHHPLQRMFAAVPRNYDLINRLFTWGLDERWRARAARTILETSPRRVLDLCCGTGDLALRLVRQASHTTAVVGADFSAPMLEVARARAGSAGLDGRLPFVLADAGDLPFPDGHFDEIGIAFAFRNLTWRNPRRERHLAEVRRVLRPGGRFVIIESSQPAAATARKVVHWYVRGVVAHLGGFLSSQRGAYRYLAESACNFPPPDEVAAMLDEAGFTRVNWQPLLGGVAALHVARK